MTYGQFEKQLLSRYHYLNSYKAIPDYFNLVNDGGVYIEVEDNFFPILILYSLAMLAVFDVHFHFITQENTVAFLLIKILYYIVVIAMANFCTKHWLLSIDEDKLFRPNMSKNDCYVYKLFSQELNQLKQRIQQGEDFESYLSFFSNKIKRRISWSKGLYLIDSNVFIFFAPIAISLIISGTQSLFDDEKSDFFELAIHGASIVMSVCLLMYIAKVVFVSMRDRLIKLQVYTDMYMDNYGL